MFDETESLLMVMMVIPEEKMAPILSGFTPVLNRHPGVKFVRDIAISHLENFSKPSGGV
jgi:hypothetical protein